MILDRIFALFENWIRPFDAETAQAPSGGPVHFLMHYVRQAKWPFVFMIVLGGFVALLEVALFYFVGRLVDLLESVNRADGWSGLMQQHGLELVLMLMGTSKIGLIFAE